MLNDRDMIRAAQRDYHRAWRAKNPEKVKAAQQRYWLKKAKAADSCSDCDRETETGSDGGNRQKDSV